MQIGLLIFLGIIIFLVGYVAMQAVTPGMTLNKFLEEKIIVRFLWVWLPIHALKRLVKEYRSKK